MRSCLITATEVGDALTFVNYLRIDADRQLGGGPDLSGRVDAQFVELAMEMFSMLADPTRVRIVLTLRGGELPVNTIAAAVDRAPAAVDRAPAAVSQHLAKLRLARIVAGRLVTDAIHQAEHALGQPRHHQTTTTGPA